MSFVALLVLAYGPLNWSFPWWVWLIGACQSGGADIPNVLKVKIVKDDR